MYKKKTAKVQQGSFHFGCKHEFFKILNLIKTTEDYSGEVRSNLKHLNVVFAVFLKFLCNLIRYLDEMTRFRSRQNRFVSIIII